MQNENIIPMWVWCTFMHCIHCNTRSKIQHQAQPTRQRVKTIPLQHMPMVWETVTKCKKHYGHLTAQGSNSILLRFLYQWKLYEMKSQVFVLLGGSLILSYMNRFIQLLLGQKLLALESLGDQGTTKFKAITWNKAKESRLCESWSSQKI